MNALAALAASSEWGVGAADAQRVFPLLRPAAMRGEVLRLAGGLTVINDCYNSNPVALAAMIDLLAATPCEGRRILAAGEMLELGPEAPALHRRAGEHAATRGIEWVFGVQGAAQEIVGGATEGGSRQARGEFFANSETAAGALTEFVRAGDLVLVKGSRGVRMERIVEALKKKFEVEVRK
jgi:UDP-N-acetylmuramoyl-tripeptide--D-alanyl-D-alanine ligase